MPDLYAKTLIRAAEIVGGEAELASRLKVTPSHLHLWILGAGHPPLDVFLTAVDIVLDRDQQNTAPWLPPTGEEGKTPGGTA